MIAQKFFFSQMQFDDCGGNHRQSGTKDMLKMVAMYL